MNVLITSSDSYSIFAGVTLTSLFENNKNLNEITVHFLTTGLSDENKSKLTELCNNYKRKIVFYNSDNLIQFFVSNDVPKYGGSYVPYFRLFFTKYITNLPERLLYLDCDLLITKSIEALEKLDFEGALYAAVPDCNGVLHRLRNVDSSKYFNNGVILFNCNKWLDENCERKILDFIKNVPVMADADQYITNFLFSDHVKSLPCRYNYGASFVFYGIKKSSVIYKWSESYKRNMQEAEKDICIYHCFPIFGKRPWNKGFLLKKLEWDYYLKISPWKNYSKTKTGFSLFYILEYILYWILPIQVFAAIHNRIFIRAVLTLPSERQCRNKSKL